MNVFRKEYRPLSEAEKASLEALKNKAQELYDLIESTPEGRYKSLAKTNLEQAVMWAVKGVTE